MTVPAPKTPARRRPGIALVLPIALVALAGCATGTAPGEPSPTGTAEGPCTEVAVVVEFGPLDAEPIQECAAAGTALDVLAEAGIETQGTADYGDQVVCRVDGRPGVDETVTVEGEEPFTEPCTSMPSASAYWALWVKPAPDAEWEYAQEGIGTLELDPGQAIGLVYTAGDDSTPPAS